MATGASTANMAIILIDARNGVLPQSRRHAYIASLLGIPHVVVAVNKLDLVDFRQDVFESIRQEFSGFAGQLPIRDLQFIPISALLGDNVVDRSEHTPWYNGPSLLQYLESVHIGNDHYLIEHTPQQTTATVIAIRHRVDINTLEKVEAAALQMNEIGAVIVETHKPLFFDPYQQNRATGAFILIDPIGNETMGAGMITGPHVQQSQQRGLLLEGLQFELSRVTPSERHSRAGHRPATLWLSGAPDIAYAAERKLFDRGCLVNVLADEQNPELLAELARISNAAGLITICSLASADAESREKALEVVGAERFVAVDAGTLPADPVKAAEEICRLLEARGFIPEDMGPLTEGAGI